MATSLFKGSSVSKISPNSSAYLPLCHPNYHPFNFSFRLSPKPNLLFLSKCSCNRDVVVRAELNEGSVKSQVSPPKEENVASEESISEFLTQVKSIIKLVNSRDVVEFELQQEEYELVIRKKEALLPSPSPSSYSIVMPQPNPVQSMASVGPTPTPTPSPMAVESSKSSHPPLKSPMIGDKVHKGQVICIIEAMKLMNEIEADQSGTIVEIIAEDGKPVSVDTPLLVIAP